MLLRRTGRCASLITGGSGPCPCVGIRNGRQSSRDCDGLLFCSPSWRLPRPRHPPPIGSTLQYNRDVRPILAENCFPCHGPDSAARKADLRLDKREAAIEAGAIAPGDLEASELIARINAADPKEVMPPAATTKTLSQKQKDVLKQWIAAGAPYQLHWSLIPPARAELPKVKNRSWARNPIDGFVLAKLEENGLSPAPEADRRTLARRVTLDLTGLTPDPAEVESFVRDRSPDAYEKTGLPAARLAPLGRASHPLLARRRPLCRYQRLSTSTISAKPGPIATGSSAPITATFPSTASPSSNSPAIFFPAARSNSKWPRDSTDAT